MQSIAHLSDLRKIVHQQRLAGQKIGCVPTMGALHDGHLSLIRAARLSTDFVVVTIFVNPTQFAPGEDFEKYPRTLQDDLEKCRQAGADLVFHPAADEVYPSEPTLTFKLGKLANNWEGAHRPGHFAGVVLVVMKLFNMVQPDQAFFGLKDYQQQLIIKSAVRELNVPVEIISCPIIREHDGLAMSSRNRYLTTEERQQALSLSQALQHAETEIQSGERDLSIITQQMKQILEQRVTSIDYAVIVDPETLMELSDPQPQMVSLIAANVGKTRLIDNRMIELPAE